jgi:hypothetical protein
MSEADPPRYRFAPTPKSFKKRFDKKTNDQQSAILKALALMERNPRHPSLQAAKFSRGGEWYARTTRGDRIWYEVEANVITLTTNCNHDMLRRR